jgi:hypothetical protein
MTEQQVQDMFDIFSRKQLEANHPILQAKAISDHVIRLQTVHAGEGVYYLFENLINKTNSGWVKMPEYLDISLLKGKMYQYRLKLKDSYGNVTLSDKPLKVSIQDKNFNYFSDDFSIPHNFVDKSVSGTIWSGFEAFQPELCTANVQNGQLSLASGNSNFQHSGKDNGPLLYREVTGDFLAEVEVTGFTGSENRRPVGFNEGGLMVFAGKLPGEDQQTALHLGVFPHYAVGNLLTDLAPRRRPQFSNRKSWEYDRFLQVERNGDRFYFRTSSDGKIWEEMPGSPLIHPKLEGRVLKVGLYQATYTNNEGYVSFDNFRLWIQK